MKDRPDERLVLLSMLVTKGSDFQIDRLTEVMYCQQNGTNMLKLFLFYFRSC